MMLQLHDSPTTGARVKDLPITIGTSACLIAYMRRICLWDNRVYAVGMKSMQS